jgi:hypothetical protein
VNCAAKFAAQDANPDAVNYSNHMILVAATATINIANNNNNNTSIAAAAAMPTSKTSKKISLLWLKEESNLS